MLTRFAHSMQSSNELPFAATACSNFSGILLHQTKTIEESPMGLSIIRHRPALLTCTLITNCHALTRWEEDHQNGPVPRAAFGCGCAQQMSSMVLSLPAWPLVPQSLPLVSAWPRPEPLVAVALPEVAVGP